MLAIGTTLTGLTVVRFTLAECFLITFTDIIKLDLLIVTQQTTAESQ